MICVLLFITALMTCTCIFSFSNNDCCRQPISDAGTSTRFIIRAKQTADRQPRRVDLRLKKLLRKQAMFRRSMKNTLTETNRDHTKKQSEQSDESDRNEKQANKRLRKTYGRKHAKRIAAILFASTIARSEAEGEGSTYADHSCNLLNDRHERDCMQTESDQHYDYDNREAVSIDTQTDSSNSKRLLSIITANVHALRPRAEIVKTWQTDILIVQETKLAPHAIGEVCRIVKDHGWTLTHGKPSEA